MNDALMAWIRLRKGVLIGLVVGLLFPFVISLVVDGAAPSAVWTNADGNAKFLQGLAIEVFILAMYAMSYDLLLGVTGLLSFGQAMFFAVGAYGFGIAVKSFELGLGGALLVVVIAAILQAILFAVVVPRVKGIAYALVTLGFASVFWIVIASSDLQSHAGAEIGLQGVVAPIAALDTTANRFVFYLITLAVLTLAYLAITKLVDSPLGRVLVASRENEERALMLGYNTFWFKFVALVVASLLASFAGVLHTLHQPIVTPHVAGLGFTVTALLIILIGGMGTVSGAIVGAGVYRLLQFFLDKWVGSVSELLIGLAYVLLVLYLPYGVVGTWRLRKLDGSWANSPLGRLLGNLRRG